MNNYILFDIIIHSITYQMYKIIKEKNASQYFKNKFII